MIVELSAKLIAPPFVDVFCKMVTRRTALVGDDKVFLAVSVEIGGRNAKPGCYPR